MFGNGAKMNGTIPMMVHLTMAKPGSPPGTWVWGVWFAVAPGSSSPATCVRRIAFASGPMSASSTSAFVVPEFP